MGNDMLNDMDLENQMSELGDNLPELVKFNVRQTFALSKSVVSHEKRIKDLEGRNNRFFGAVGGASGILGAAFVKAIDFLITRGNG